MEGDPRTTRTRTRSRALRRQGSDAERHLWRHLRGRQLAGAKFRRQHPLGPYFADFCCPAARLVVELDGGQHAAATDKDAARTRHLESLGIRVVRFWNHDVLARTDAVLETIRRELLRSARDRGKLNPSP